MGSRNKNYVSALPGGGVSQSSIPKPARGGSSSAGSTLLRGVVINTYGIDDPNNPLLAQKCVSCDVRVSSGISGFAWQNFPACMVLQNYGMHGGDIWMPRPSSMDITGKFDEDVSNFANLDGDHVLVSFIDDQYNQPIILGGIPHPSKDIGNDADDLGHRTGLTQADIEAGIPKFWNHHGSYFGIDKDGNFHIDLTRAHSGEYLSDGSEPEHTTGGNFTLKLPASSVLNVLVEGGANLLLENKDADAKLTLGSGAVSLAIADHLEVLYTTLKTQFDNHLHATGVGPSGPASGAGFTAPSWNSKINSTKAKIPDE